ncbi:protein eiger isoform X1 [Ceratitis capitata]|uniref:Ectodysplasin-A n=2 Tax=Ceratitis capitata TaxID=7213 RepID=W8C875_CERCA|nr:protein eiger isoform X1 [Ceratitis capitata]
MTTETLKPFLSTSRCGDNSISMPLNTTRRHSRSINVAAITLSTIAVTLTLCLLVLVIVQRQRISQFDAEVDHLKKIMCRMQERLGLTNLEDDGDYGNEHNPVFINKPKKIISEEDTLNIEDYGSNKEDDGDYESEVDYQDFKNGLSVTDYDSDDEDGDVIDDDIINSKTYIDEDDDSKNDQDFYSDFSRFNATLKKKKSARKTRSIVPVSSSEDYYGHDTSQVRNTRQNNGGVVSNDYSQQKKILAHRQSLRREEARKIAFEQSTRPNVQRSRKFSSPYHSYKRKHKNDNLKSAKSTGQTRTGTFTPAAHFHLVRKIPDRYSTIKIDSFSGDMYIGHPSWSNEIAVDNYFKVENGALTVYEPGLYYVYAQVCYNNTHDQNGFVIFHGHKPFLQCLNTVPTNIIHKIHTCHTSGLIYLRENETIHLRDFHSDRNVILKDANNRSYFGLIKI